MAFETKPLTYDEFMALVKEQNPNADMKLVAKAYNFGAEAHKGQKRKAGEEYYVHPVEVAHILLARKADSATICAALLHDIVEDTSVPLSTIEKEFGKEVADLVEGLTKISGKHFESKEDYKAENLRKILLATTKDVRVILIKLADRLHNMRTLATFREDKRKRIAQETMDIYAPIAHKLGMWRMRGELEDLAFRYVEPEAYIRLKEIIAEKRAEREEATQELVEKIRVAVSEKHIDADVFGRAKYFHSIFKKMKEKHKSFEDIYDLIALRIIVNNVDECYKVLDIVHTLFEPLLDRFKDYIKHPKANGYQSIHTAVKSHGKIEKILEIQIRTHDMHHVAEEGIAAHWKYKSQEKDKAFDRKIVWLKQILDWLKKSKDAAEFVETLKIDLFENEIIVFTPKGDPISLPRYATAVDFAFAVHSGVGEKCSKAKVNQKIEPLDYELKSGDVVEIITQNNAKPSRNWLKFVVTSKAKSKIRSALGIEVEHKPKEERLRQAAELEKQYSESDHIEIKGKKAPVKFSKCCEPKIGDSIKGFYTKDGHITIHRSDCINIHSLGSARPADVSWVMPKDLNIKKLKVSVKEEPRILVDILNLLANEKVVVHSVNSRTRKRKVLLSFKIETDDSNIERIEELIRKIPDVIAVNIDSN